MSTNQKTYVIYGYSMEWRNLDNFSNETYKILESYMYSFYQSAKINTPIVLDDGRDGRFCLIGIVLNASDVDGGFNDVLEAKVNAKQKKELKKFIENLRETLPADFELEKMLSDQKPGFWIATIYR